MKKSKKNLANRVGKKVAPKKHNPFEVRINRSKYDVLGKKSKNEKGLPGISRSKAIKKRKATLLQDYKLKDKVNQFVDRRIGEHDKSMTADDKILARYTTERMRFHSKKSLYNLDDNEVLTHRGESLAEIEKFEDPKSDEDDDDEDGPNRSGKLDEKFVSDAHFGGGMLKKTEGENKSRKDLIDQLIAESKLRKAEKQREREKTLDLTERLDTEWRDVMQLVASSKGSRNDDGVILKSDRKYASYDVLSKELIFEARGKPTDKLKSEALIAKEEKEKLEKLEKERLARMMGDDGEKQPRKHKSADDLDDGFDYDFVPKKKRKRGQEEDNQDDEEEQDSQFPTDANEEGSDDDDDDEEEEEEADGSENEEGNNENEEEEEDDSDVNLSDLKSSDDESDSETVEKPKPKKSPTKNKNEGDLPFVLNVPETYEEFETLCAKKEPQIQAVIVERMIKSNHPSLPSGTTVKLITLFNYCLQHLQDTATDPETKLSSFKVLNKLAPWLYDMAQKAPLPICSSISDVIKEKYGDYLKKPKKFSSIDTLVFLKLIGILFPTSDYRHRIVTPSLVFMQQILATCRINSSSDVAKGLFIATLILEFTALAKRITPEAINFLRGVLRLSQSFDCPLPAIPPFKTKMDFSLHVPSTTSGELTALGVNDLILNTNSENFKIRAVNMTLRILNAFCENLDQASHFIILEPFEPLLDLKNHPECLKPSIEPVINRIKNLKQKKLYKLVNDKKKPKPLKLYEPKIEEVYTLKKKQRSMNQEKDERDKLLYKYKKEVKGALREIRRDNTFLSKLKYNETKASDQERMKKVKEIFGDAAQQAGDLNKIKRRK